MTTAIADFDGSLGPEPWWRCSLCERLLMPQTDYCPDDGYGDEEEARALEETAGGADTGRSREPPRGYQAPGRTVE